MKKAYNQALQRKFAEAMRNIPQFSEIDVHSPYFSRSERLYEMKLGGLSCFIILVPSQQGRNEFTIELGWSMLGRSPELPGRPSGFHSDDYKEFANNEFVFRISDLHPRYNDRWWLLRRPRVQQSDNPLGFAPTILEDSVPLSLKEAETVVEPLVKDCIDTIVEYALPYFEKLAEYHTKKEKGVL